MFEEPNIKLQTPEQPVQPPQPESTEPEPGPLTKKQKIQELHNKAATLEKGLTTERTKKIAILIELGYLNDDSGQTEEEIDHLLKISLLKTKAQAEKLEEEEEEQDDDSDDDDDDTATQKNTDEDHLSQTPHQLAEQMIKQDLKQAFEKIPALYEVIKMNGWDHLHLRTNRDQQLVIMTEQDGKLTPLEVWDGMQIIKHQGLFDLVAHLEQTDHIQ